MCLEPAVKGKKKENMDILKIDFFPFLIFDGLKYIIIKSQHLDLIVNLAIMACSQKVYTRFEVCSIRERSIYSCFVPAVFFNSL
jgi:hypothetical protein